MRVDATGPGPRSIRIQGRPAGLLHTDAGQRLAETEHAATRDASTGDSERGILSHAALAVASLRGASTS